MPREPISIPGEALAREVARAAGRRGAARSLLLDVDGTLAPIAPTPDQAEVPPVTLASIGRLVHAGWTVVLVSGRPINQIRSMVPVEGAVAFGSHGLEGGFDESGGKAQAVPVAVLERLDALESQAAQLADSFPGVRIERKPAGLAFHDRLVPEKILPQWRSTLDAWLESRSLDGLVRLEGRRVLELRPRGFDKGRVVRLVKDRLNLAGEDRSIVAIGDDVTDEDMFHEIRESGLAVIVGKPTRASEAVYRLGSPEEVATFLRALADSAGSAS